MLFMSARSRKGSGAFGVAASIDSARHGLGRRMREKSSPADVKENAAADQPDHTLRARGGSGAKSGLREVTSEWGLLLGQIGGFGHAIRDKIEFGTVRARHHATLRYNEKKLC